MKELSNFKKISTKSEANEIIEIAMSDRFKIIVEKYSKTETNDLYSSGLSAELLNRAGRAINTLMRK